MAFSRRKVRTSITAIFFTNSTSSKQK